MITLIVFAAAFFTGMFFIYGWFEKLIFAVVVIADKLLVPYPISLIYGLVCLGYAIREKVKNS